MSDFVNICLQEIKEEETKCKLKVTLLIIKLIFTAKVASQPAFICSKLTTETQGVKYVQGNNKDNRTMPKVNNKDTRMSLLLTLNIFHTLL